MTDEACLEISPMAAAARMVHLHICSSPDLAMHTTEELDAEVEQLVREMDPVDLAAAFLALIDLALTVDDNDRRVEFALTLYYTMAVQGHTQEGTWLMQ